MAAQSTSGAGAIIAALLDIVDRQGLDQVSVREVATGAGVSIGTVQHYFPTKDAMLVAAYREVIDRLRARLDAVPTGDDVRRNVTNLLTELLPLDKRRVAETRIHLAFAARAATSPDLAQIQRAALAEIHAGLVAVLSSAGTDPDDVEHTAHAAVAVADGLALHAVSSGRWLSRARQQQVLMRTLDALLPRA